MDSKRLFVRIADIVVQPGENASQDHTRYVFDFKSLTPITDRVAVIPGAGYAAGVPDRATAAAQGWDYDKICSFFSLRLPSIKTSQMAPTTIICTTTPFLTIPI